MIWQHDEHGWRREARQGTTDSLVILLHGVGSNGADLLPLADFWSHSLPGTAFVALDGCESFAGGGEGRQWFDLSGITPDNRPARVTAAYPALLTMLDAEVERHGVAPARVALAGFSQGTIMALHHLVNDTAGMAALIGYSGRLASSPRTATTTAVTLVHGEQDPVIPFQETLSAAQTLAGAGFAVASHIVPGVMHTISVEGAELGLAALQRALRNQA